MGSKCTCLSTQQELRRDSSNITSIYSPTTSQNRRFTIQESPLRLSEVFRTTTTKHQHIELIESNESEYGHTNNKLDTSPLHDVHPVIDHLISGYIPYNIHHLTVFSIIKKICYAYYSHYLFTPSPNANNYNDEYSIIIDNVIDDKSLLDLLCTHWKQVRLQFYAPIIHLQLLFRATELDMDGINDNCINLKLFHQKCDNKGNTLLIIKSTDNNIFGGFTSINYANQQQCIYDSQAFLWSLSSNKIFDLNHNCLNVGKENIFHYGENDKIAIQFGNGPDLIVYKKCFMQNMNNVVPYSFDFNVDELIGTQHKNGYFTVKQMEVFQVYGL